MSKRNIESNVSDQNPNKKSLLLENNFKSVFYKCLSTNYIISLEHDVHTNTVFGYTYNNLFFELCPTTKQVKEARLVQEDLQHTSNLTKTGLGSSFFVCSCDLLLFVCESFVVPIDYKKYFETHKNKEISSLAKFENNGKNYLLICMEADIQHGIEALIIILEYKITDTTIEIGLAKLMDEFFYEEINKVAFYPGPKNPSFIITGDNDGLINMFETNSMEAVNTINISNQGINIMLALEDLLIVSTKMEKLYIYLMNDNLDMIFFKDLNTENCYVVDIKSVNNEILIFVANENQLTVYMYTLGSKTLDIKHQFKITSKESIVRAVVYIPPSNTYVLGDESGFIEIIKIKQ